MTVVVAGPPLWMTVVVVVTGGGSKAPVRRAVCRGYRVVVCAHCRHYPTFQRVQIISQKDQTSPSVVPLSLLLLCICCLLAGPFSALLLLLLLVIHFKFTPRQNYCSNHIVASMHLKSEATGFSIDSLLFTQFARLFIVRSMLR